MSEPILKVQDLHVHFQIETGSVFRHRYHTLRAVDGVNLEVKAGETLGVVGESGCGKSTLARAMIGLSKPTRGRVLWMGEDLSKLDDESLRNKRKELQIIFQNPLGALNPRMNVGEIIAEPLKTFYPGMQGVQVRERVKGMLKMVGLLPNQINRYPHEFSGGQCQRIGIARALILNPKLVVCDEPVSALDVSVQAQIVNLLKDLQQKLKLSLVFIAHDLSVVRHVSDRVLVMYLGKVMEVASRAEIYSRPRHPYTSALVKAAPIPDPKIESAKTDIGLLGDMPSRLEPISGCVFRNRCPYAVERCAHDVPTLRVMQDDNCVACHEAENIDLSIHEHQSGNSSA